jgi:hypothetical protein
VKRSPFSLVEVIIACLLLTTCAGACYIAFNRAYKERQHKEIISRITDTLRQAYKFAQLSNAEVTVIFSKNSSGKREISLSNDLLTDTKVKMQGTKPETLEGVTELKIVPGTEEKDRAKLKFFPWGIVNPNTIIEVQFANDQTHHKIVLDDYLLQKVHETANEDLYPKDVLEDEKEKKSVRAP